MPTVGGTPNRRRSVNHFKPKGYENYVTLTELSDILEKETSWIRELERLGRIPKAHRVKRGRLMVRLWSPEQVKEIQAIFATHHVGRPRGS